MIDVIDVIAGADIWGLEEARSVGRSSYGSLASSIAQMTHTSWSAPFVTVSNGVSGSFSGAA